MNQMNGFLTGALVAGIWTLVALQLISNSQTYAQETSGIEQRHEDQNGQFEDSVINATEIIGLTALIEKVVRDSQFKPHSISGLDQHIKSIVRGCRVSGGVSGSRISHANISC